MLPLIDLRSDTVTLPTDAMRDAMARAEVGDDVYLEDPTVNRLQEAAAAALGKEAGLFVPSGSMGNLLAVKCHTQPGDLVLIEANAHIVQFEMGGLAWFSGALPQPLATVDGVMSPEDVRAAVRHDVAYYQQRTALICVENTHNSGGGTVYPLETLAAIRGISAELGVPVHMDGARIFNAAVAQGVPAAEIAQFADSVMFCFSKGLSAPVGSILCGNREFVEHARRVRRAVGGGMRQAGILAAAALVALETMVDRLAEDHATARRLAEGLAEIPGMAIDPERTVTNIVVAWPAGGPPACRALIAGLKERGVLIGQVTPDTVRMVTHRHVGYNEVDSALQAVRETLALTQR
jgi:threonine aldolase